MAQQTKQDVSDIVKIVREVYTYVPSPEAYVGGFTDISTTDGIARNFMRHALREFGITKENCRGENAPKVSKADMEALWEKMYGKGSFGIHSRSNSAFPYDFMEQPWMFMYVQQKDEYVFEYTGVELPSPTPYRKLLRWESGGGRLYVYDIFGIIGDNGEYGAKKKFCLNGAVGKDPKENSYTLLNFAPGRGMGKAELQRALIGGDYDRILPTYKHTFRRTPDGYVWISSEIT